MKDTNSLFASATRRKLRFDTLKGNFSVEEAWDLNLTQLDQAAQLINSRLEARGATKSFLAKGDAKADAARKDDETRLAILVFIIETKEAEAREKAAAAAKRQQITFLKGLRDKKTLESLESQDLAEIERQIAELEGGEAPAPVETAEA
jgi:hypothetical protein